MKSLISKIVIGAAGLALATAPLAASAQSWQGHGSANRGGHVQHGGGYQRGGGGYQRGGGYERGGGGYQRSGWGGGVHVNLGYAQPVYEPPVGGYYGWAPGGFQGYYWNGNWYHHRRWNGGVWIYF